jgi:hypothetical protein
MKTKLFIDVTKIYKYRGVYWLIPCVSLQYNNERFLETGVYSPAFSLQISFLNFTWGIIIQKGY